MANWFTVAGTIGVAVIGIAIYQARKRGTIRLLADREPLGDEEIYSRFYASSGLAKSLVIELWHEVASSLGLAPERLLPTDRFGKDIGVYWLTSDNLDVLGAITKQRASQQGLKVDLASLGTVDEYVRFFATSSSR